MDGAAPTFALGAGMSAPAARPWAWEPPKKAAKSVLRASRLIETGMAVSCRDIHPVRRLRQAGFEHHP